MLQPTTDMINAVSTVKVAKLCPQSRSDEQTHRSETEESAVTHVAESAGFVNEEQGKDGDDREEEEDDGCGQLWS